jgi:hypothetical protein
MGIKLGISPEENKNGLRVFEENWLLRIFGPKRKEVTGGFRASHNEEFHNV